MASIIQKRKFRYIAIFSLAILGALHGFWLSKTGIDFIPNVALSLLFIFCLLLSFLLIGNNLSYFRPQNLSYSYFLIVWAVFFGAFSAFLPTWIFSLIFNELTLIKAYLNDTQYVRLFFTILLMVSYIVACLLWYILDDFKENQKLNQETLMLNKEAELTKLRTQLQPHFLFNSLNSINALIGSKPNEARKMIQQLSDFLRFTIKKEDNQLVHLEEELSHLALYLEIEKVRFGHRLNTSFECQPETLNMKIPALLLQPIVENAIKFGLYDTIDSVEINLVATNSNGILNISISNPFDPNSSPIKKGTGFGLSSVRKRLQLLYNRTDLLVTHQNENIFISELKIPQLNDTSNNS